MRQSAVGVNAVGGALLLTRRCVCLEAGIAKRLYSVTDEYNVIFRPQMIQSGLFAPNTFVRCDFLQLRIILQQSLLPEVTFKAGLDAATFTQDSYR